MITLGFWNGNCQDSIIDCFEPYDKNWNRTTKIDRSDVDVLFAWYDDPWGYSGQAFVLFRKCGEYQVLSHSFRQLAE